MSTVTSRSSHRYSTQNSINGSRRLSDIPYTSSQANARFPERQLSIPRDQLKQRPLSSSSHEQTTDMITIALAKAQNAVLLDQRNNVMAALDGYSQCCAILAEAIAKESDYDDITRLRQIHDTYSVRMHVLSAQLEPSPLNREMPPLPSQADIQEFEEEDDEEDILQTFPTPRRSNALDPPPQYTEYRYSEVQPLAVQMARPTLHRAASSRDSTTVSRPPVSARKHSHSRTSSYTQSYSQESSFSRTHSQEGSLGSLEQIPATPYSQREIVLLPEMIDEEEMDDAAFLERITRGFTSDEEILEDEIARPSTTSSTASSSNQHQAKKPADIPFPVEALASAPAPMTQIDTDDFILPSPRTDSVTPRQPSPVPKPKHDRARNPSSPLPTTKTHPPPPAKKNLPIGGGAQPMPKSLSANNAIPNPDEIIVPGNLEAAPAVPPKIKKRPQLIRVVSETTMRTNYRGSRISTYELSPVSPPSTASILTPGTSNSILLSDGPSVKNVIMHDRDGVGAPEDPPEDRYLRPYWLMRALAQSMKHQKGAYINGKMFVPQGVWTLKNVKLKATEEKMHCFQLIVVAVRQVLDTDYRNVTLLLQEVGNLEATMEGVQQNLLKKMDGKTNGANTVNGDNKTMGRKMSQVKHTTLSLLTIVNLTRRLGKTLAIKIIRIVDRSSHNSPGR